MKAREDASGALLNYGYTFYETKLVVKGGTKLAASQVWKAADTPVDLGIKDDLWLTLPRGGFNSVKTTVDVEPRLIAPLQRDATVGELHVTAGNQSVANLPIHPLSDVAAGGWWRRMVDTIHLWFA
jgi:D-alanyl-D-alanine carboxypeptidase (penicillin-binding protein 5/6)